jgi:hypothetical protein
MAAVAASAHALRSDPLQEKLDGMQIVASGYRHDHVVAGRLVSRTVPEEN